MKWLTEELTGEIKRVFEPRYARQLSDSEVQQIAIGLTTFMEHYSKWKIDEIYKRLQKPL